ncbi:MAG: GGDEF domain-containing protein [Candidatus Micrarchaeota archaeon]|nr:GGDEF domain-containing protein [Candidatus Micrarchaeota archaeon]
MAVRRAGKAASTTEVNGQRNGAEATGLKGLARRDNAKDQRIAELEGELADREIKISRLERDSRSKDGRIRHLESVAYIDELTGVGNRRYMYDHARLEISRRSRGDQRPLSFVLLDLNGLKAVNDHPDLGHDAGDEMLKHVAAVLQATSRPTDTVARIGGDEFVVILSGADAKGAEAFVKSARQALAQAPIQVNSVMIYVEFSAGITTLTRRGDDGRVVGGSNPLRLAKRMVKEADAEMYTEKRENGAARNPAAISLDKSSALLPRIPSE